MCSAHKNGNEVENGYQRILWIYLIQYQNKWKPINNGD